ncbi:MAG: aspartate--tRNA ligase [Patescibacteria group bacterium]|nr:aspartate--tRNA ligase [Patescibacteria group bacterium]MDD5121247.1 aspartate--tRNA ligase [Patescibacteria group bacterium]MDD5222092.1 aspartate--tRNA ligase [Patescibacteria group bacterium]MDD5395834.1 aspartate--tRNA ligase [Patescibacteria group bacterium]
MNRIWTKDAVNKVGEKVLLKGWVNTRRNMGKIVFIDLRDRSSLAQVVFVPQELDEQSNEAVKKIRPEFVVEIEGIVNARPKNQINQEMLTGSIEILAKKLTILSEAKTPPFTIDNEIIAANEELRLKYRYLDLRHERVKNNLILRSQVCQFFRDYLNREGFLEVETPILTKGTPEGAREFAVPSRLYPGKFYVLPQSPQQFKQLLMVGGIERYFQLARCFRDEDARGDRQPEFTQLDLEMSFVNQEDVLALNERMFIELIKTVAPKKIVTTVPFPRISYQEAIEKYGNDKPDLRKDKTNPDELAFCWIVDFPMFEPVEGGDLQATHHPFCMPNPEDVSLLDTDPLRVRAASYDLVLNGYELSSGSIRIHQRELQQKIFELLGLSKELIQARFGHMLEAFEYGTPPHGGMAPGIDRLVMILANEPNIREVIPFPKTTDAKDLMMEAPSEMTEEQLKEINICLRNKK